MSGLGAVMTAKVKTSKKPKTGSGKDGRKNPKAFSVANIVRILLTAKALSDSERISR